MSTTDTRTVDEQLLDAAQEKPPTAPGVTGEPNAWTIRGDID